MGSMVIVSEYASMPGRFSVKKRKASGRVIHVKDCSCASSAAAEAIASALKESPVAKIFGPKSVLVTVPASMK